MWPRALSSKAGENPRAYRYTPINLDFFKTQELKEALMTDAKLNWRSLTQETPELKMDYRLVEKKIEEGFMTREEFEAWIKELPEETEFDFTSAEELEKED